MGTSIAFAINRVVFQSFLMRREEMSLRLLFSSTNKMKFEAYGSVKKLLSFLAKRDAAGTVRDRTRGIAATIL